MCIFIYEINLDTKYISFLNLDLIMFIGFIRQYWKYIEWRLNWRT